MRYLQLPIRVRTVCGEPVSLRVTLTTKVRLVARVSAAAAGELLLAERSLRRLAPARTMRLVIPTRLRRTLGRRAVLRLRIEATDASLNRRVTTTRIRYERGG